MRGFRFGISFDHSNSRPCRKPKRRDGVPKHKSAEDSRFAWPLGHSFWAFESTYQAIVKEYWSKSGLRPSRNGPTKQPTPDNEHGERRGHDVRDTKRESWFYPSLDNGQDVIHKRQTRSRYEPQPENRGSQQTSTQPGSFFIDPITNRKVPVGSQASEYKSTDSELDKTEDDFESNLSAETIRQDGQQGREAQAKDVDTAKSGPDIEASRSESKQSALRDDDLLKYRPVTDESFILDLGKNSNEPKPTEVDRTHGKTPLHFDDLRPPSAESAGDTFASADGNAHLVDNMKKFDDGMRYGAKRDEAASAKEHVLGSDNDSGDPELLKTAHASAQGDSSPSVTSRDEVQTFSSEQSDPKPAGYVEEPVAPERLHEYPCIVEQTGPGDFPQSTIEDLRQKYDTAEVKKYTAVRCYGPDGQPATTAQDILTNHESQTEHEHVTINENGHEHLLSELPGETSRNSDWLTDTRHHDSPQRMAPGEMGIADASSPEPLIKLHDNQMEESVETKYKQRLEAMQKLSDAVRRHEILSDAADREAALAVKVAKAKNSARKEAMLATKSRAKADADREARQVAKLADGRDEQHTLEKRLTGNYARDFPEEFEKSWTQALSSTETFDSSYEQPMPLEAGSMDGGLEGAFGQPGPSKIQPALDRHRKAQEGSEHPRELGTYSSSQESREAGSSWVRSGGDNAVESSYVKHVGSVTGAGKVDPGHSDVTAEEPAKGHESSRQPSTSTTLYKILAYDPTLQTISIAETSSIVADFTSALSPAAALSRLSHPNKFFPHFASLEADGFEIVSGSGDVLVFRKARPSAAEREASRTETDTSTATDARLEPNPTPINPIDMTGRPKFMTPASANFASPTGYVAYPESEPMDLPPPPPRVKYNIDLRREEPVYSGPKIRSNKGEGGQKKSLVKRVLVGGVWVASISYGLGVVSEYFTTGGVDGIGPTGF